MATTQPFFDLSSYQNMYYALDTSLFTHYANLIFGGDPSRIIYSKTNFAFRRRTWLNTKSENSPITFNTLDLPFMNFKIDSIDTTTNYSWWNNVVNARGIYVPELNKSIRATPVTVNYDSTFFCHRDDELKYVWDQLVWDSSNQTIINPTITINQCPINLFGNLGYNLEYNPDYDEQAHLDIAKIWSIRLNFNVETVIIRLNEPGTTYGIPEKIIIDFFTWCNPDTDEGFNTQYQYLIDCFNDEVVPIL